MKLFTIIFLLFFGAENLFSQESIYNSEKPHLINIWNRVADYSPVLRAVESAELSKDGLFAASASKFGYNVIMWDIKDGTVLWEESHESEVECITFSPNGKKLASGGEDYFINIYNSKSGEIVKKLEHDSGIDGITWSENGQIIASGSEKGDVWFWNANNYELIEKVNLGSTINSLQFFDNDSKIVIAGNNQHIDEQTGKNIYTGFAVLYDLNIGKVIANYIGNRASIKSVRVSNNKKYVATGSFDSTACLFELETGKLIKQFKHTERVEAVAFSLDDHFLITGGHEHKISFYRLSDLELAYTLNSPRTEYIDISKDGRLMLTSHEDSGVLSLYLFISDLQNKQDLYHKISEKLLNNRDLKKK